MPINIEPIRYDQGFISIDKRGLIITKKPFDLTNIYNIKSIKIEGIQPENTQRKILFMIDDLWKKWNGDSWINVDVQDIYTESVLEEGNSVDELIDLNSDNLTIFNNKVINIAIALYAPLEVESPTIKILFEYIADSIIYYKEEISDMFVLNSEEEVKLLDINPNINIINNGSFTLKARFKTTDDWEDYTNFIGKDTRAIQFKAIMEVDDSTSIVDFENVNFKHNSNSNLIVNNNLSSIFTKTYDFSKLISSDIEMTNFTLLVNSYDNKYSDIEALISLRNSPKIVENLILGSGNDLEKTFILDHKANPSSIKLYHNNKLKVMGNDYSYNTLTREIKTTAVNDEIIKINYEYDNENEILIPLINTYNSYNESNFYKVDSEFKLNDGLYSGSLSSVRINMFRKEGSENIILDTSIGSTQYFILKHPVKTNTIVVKANDSIINESNWNYNENTHILSINYLSGFQLSVEYDWVGSLPIINNIAGIWNY